MKSCYVIRPDRKHALYLTPFVDAQGSSSWSAEEEIRWHASTMLNSHEKDEALFTLYTQIDKGVDRWIQDYRYFPRLIAAALVFLIAYFFFSLAIRDPIPMVDELLLAGGLAVATAVFIARRDKQSDLAMKKRLELKQQASRSDFVILEELGAYERYLSECAYLDSLDLADRLVLASDAQLPELTFDADKRGAWQEEVAELLILSVRIQDKLLYNAYKKVLNIRKAKKPDEAFGARLLKLAMNRHLDLPLLALMIAVTKQ